MTNIRHIHVVGYCALDSLATPAAHAGVPTLPRIPDVHYVVRGKPKAYSMNQRPHSPSGTYPNFFCVKFCLLHSMYVYTVISAGTVSLPDQIPVAMIGVGPQKHGWHLSARLVGERTQRYGQRGNVVRS